MPRLGDADKRISFDQNKKTKRGQKIEYYDGLRKIKNLGAGDSFYIPKLFRGPESKEIFEKLLTEAKVKQMFNISPNSTKGVGCTPIPRLVIAQTTIDKYSHPIYRMPGCNESNIPVTKWSPTVEKVRKKASSAINQELNHCVVTLYRDENDSLGFHHDKLLDLVENSLILSISFGTPRPIIFRNNGNRKRHVQTIVLQPGSLLAIGPKTNVSYQHTIPKVSESTGPRISLSLRSIATFHDLKSGSIKGQGQKYQTLNYPMTPSYGHGNEIGYKIKDSTLEHMKSFEIKTKNDIEKCLTVFQKMNQSSTSDSSSDDDESGNDMEIDITTTSSPIWKPVTTFG